MNRRDLSKIVVLVLTLSSIFFNSVVRDIQLQPEVEAETSNVTVVDSGFSVYDTSEENSKAELWVEFKNTGSNNLVVDNTIQPVLEGGAYALDDTRSVDLKPGESDRTVYTYTAQGKKPSFITDFTYTYVVCTDGIIDNCNSEKIHKEHGDSQR